jgi:hypothetical protein
MSCIIYPSSSIVENDELGFFTRLSFIGRSVLHLLCFGSRCLSSLDSNVPLYSSHCGPLDALLDSWLLLNSLFFLQYPIRTSLHESASITMPLLIADMIMLHSPIETYISFLSDKDHTSDPMSFVPIFHSESTK